MNYIIKNGRVIDPANGIDGSFDILISEGKIAKVGKGLNQPGAEIIDASGNIVAPGFIDMHTHLREPGREDEETVKTGTRAAIRGGFTAVAAMPNTDPAMDSAEKVKALENIISKDALANVLVIGAVTVNRSGSELTDLAVLKKTGIVGISDDGTSVDNEALLEEALKRAKKEELLLIEHCEDPALSKSGVMNKGFVATKMGLRGISKESEYQRIERDLKIAGNLSVPIHVAHISCKESVDIIRKAKAEGVKVSAETAPHYFSLTDACCATYDTNTKMNPPLRTAEDVEAIKRGLSDGTIDAIATDHAPHTDAEKDVEFDFAPFGIIGLETALSIAVMELVDKNIISWKVLIEKLSVNPARLLKTKGGSLKEGSSADIVIIDQDKEYIYKRETIESKSKNSPFVNWKLKGKIKGVFVSGRCIMKDEAIIG